MNPPKKLRFTFFLTLMLVLLLTACGADSGQVEPPFIRIVSGTVQAGTGGAWSPAGEDVKLAAESSIKTDKASYALLTFKDGSTIELEPETELALSKGTGISAVLNSGQVWVIANTATATIDAGGPTASGTATAFSITRNGSEVTVSATGGKAKFTASGSTVEVGSGQIAKSSGAGPEAPAAIQVKNALRINLTGEALLYLADPQGRAIGYHPTKEIFTNQIPNSWYAGKAGRPQVITVPNITEGEYTILMVAANNQSAWKIQIGFAGSDLKFDQFETSSSITWGTPTGITMKVRLDANGVPKADISAIWTLYVNPPGKVSEAADLKHTTVNAGADVPAWAR
jgi:hypothetical protein